MVAGEAIEPPTRRIAILDAGLRMITGICCYGRVRHQEAEELVKWRGSTVECPRWGGVGAAWIALAPS